VVLLNSVAHTSCAWLDRVLELGFARHGFAALLMEPERRGLEDLRIDRSDVEENGARSWRFWLFAGLTLLLLTGAVWWLRQRPIEVQTQVVRSEMTEPGPRTVLNASGYVVARREATVSSKLTGKVVDILIEEGTEVKEGQILARLDDANLRARLELAQAQANAARGGLLETQVRLDEAEREQARILTLAGGGVSSEAEVDRVEAEVKSLRARLERQILEIEVAHQQVRVLTQELEDTVIRAPFTGIVVAKNAQPGEMISPISAGGGFTRTGIGTIVDMSSLEIEVDVNESFLNRVRVGQFIEATLDAYPAWKIPCRVLAIIPTADRQKATVRVRVAFDELDQRILPQMGVRVAFLELESEREPGPGSLMIARETLRRNGTDYWVWVVRDGKLDRRPVTVRAPETNPVLVDSGLEAGETVVVQAPEDLEPGRRVRVRTD
jgi:HlyD family secretion protein